MFAIVVSVILTTGLFLLLGLLYLLLKVKMDVQDLCKENDELQSKLRKKDEFTYSGLDEKIEKLREILQGHQEGNQLLDEIGKIFIKRSVGVSQSLSELREYADRRAIKLSGENAELRDKLSERKKLYGKSFQDCQRENQLLDQTIDNLFELCEYADRRIAKAKISEKNDISHRVAGRGDVSYARDNSHYVVDRGFSHGCNFQSTNKDNDGTSPVKKE